MTEQFANAAVTTLNGAIDGIVTSLTLTSAAAFPGSGTFRLLIDSEILLVTGVAGSVLTVTRGAESSTAAAHANGATVTAILTAGALVQLKADAGGGSSLPVTVTRVRKTANYTIVAATDYIIETAVNAFTVTMPASPADGNQFVVCNNNGNSVTVAGNGHAFSDPLGSTSLTLSPSQSMTFTYSSSSSNWLIT